MSESRFLMQIIDKQSGEVVNFPPGQSVEKDFVSEVVNAISTYVDFSVPVTSQEFVDKCVAAIVARGVGFTKTEAHVTEDITNGIREVLVKFGLEDSVKAANDMVASRARAAMEHSILELKKRIRS